MYVFLIDCITLALEYGLNYLLFMGRKCETGFVISCWIQF